MRWLAVFTLLLCVSCTPPVLAESSRIGIDPARVVDTPATAESPSFPEEAQPEPEEPSGETPEAIEGEEAAHEEWLDSPEAILQREESRTAFVDLSAAEAEGVLSSAFVEQLQQLDGDPSRALSDLQIEEILGTYSALVPDEEGGSQLVESPIPVLSERPGEEAKPVDLGLKESEDGFVSETPAIDVELPNSLGGKIEIADELAISGLPGNPDVQASRFGDMDLFFANTDTDTDTFVSPLTRSVEVFEQLRSPKSPEQFRFELSLPEGTTLRSDGEGGAEIVDSAEKRIAFVPAPYAVDAQGTDVSVSMGVDGDTLVLDVPHSSLEVAYPILLDPELVTESWYWSEGNTFGLGYWQWQEIADYENSTGCIVTCWGAGLYARSKGSNHWYGANTWGRWVYYAPNSTAFISRAVFWTLRGSVYNCPTNQPHGWLGLWNGGAGTYSGLGVYSPLSFSATSFDTGWVGNTGTREAHVAIGTGGSPSQLACGHDFYVGGATIYQDDPENPTIGSVPGIPSVWLKETPGWITDSPAFTITANTSDPGLGVKKITLTRDGQPTIEKPVGCNGTAASRCPVNRSQAFELSGLSFDEGKKSAAITVEDATARKTTYSWTTQVDRTKPDLSLSGQLAVATDEDEGEEKDPEKWDELSLPVYNLDIKATDVGPESDPNAKRRSGVKKIEVLLDGAKQQEWEQPCSHSCSMEKTYALKLNNLDAGKHVLKVIATDHVGKAREREIEFEFIPATGMKDEYVMHYFPLPDGQGDEGEEEHPSRPELAVNVMNGNLVYRERDVEVPGYSVDLEVERYYNSLLPEEENTEWGDGWTLAQTPDLEPEETEGSEPPAEALMVRTSGAVEGSVALPASVGATKFDPQLQAVVTKETGGGYEVADATGETDTAVAFDDEGEVTELRTEGLARVDYDYEAGELAEIEVHDPATTISTPEEVAKRAERDDITPAFKYSFGLKGTGNGEFDVATDVAIDPTDATIWVSDDENGRVQHFSSVGVYLDQFKSCPDPGAVEIDLQGNVYVACSSSDRVQKFNDKGEFLKQLAGPGEGNGQVRFPLDLVLDAEGNLWIADTEHNRVQKISPTGEFLKAIPLGDGSRPWGVDVAPDGRIWVAERAAQRVSVFDPQGEALFQFGSYGAGHSQFASPVDVEVDEAGHAWVADAVNNRVQVFDSEGAYITQFGEKGTGDGQLDTEWWLRLALGPEGEVWVTDSGNHRVQRWRAAGRAMAGYGLKVQDDPKVEVEVAGGLVESLEGEEAGEHAYTHVGDLLIAHDGPEGKTEYEYDEAGRMTRVELPNGTWAEIEYGSTDGRVKSLTVDPAGTEPEKTTTFTYTDQPRKTTVNLPDAPAVTYEIGNDGSVFKWQNALKPPEFEDIAGTLYDVENKETAAPIGVGTYNLVVQAYSEEGIASIQILANGDQLVSEKTCPQVYEEPAACKKLPDEWVTDTGAHAPGILNLEMVIEDRIGQVASERFWVNIPYTPPPPPGEPAKPTFADVLEFREEHGLDLDLDPIQDELELNDRVFDTINDWIQGKSVAVASMERWGAPLRTPEAAELEYRLAYWKQASEVIPAWAAANAPSTFVGLYIDEPGGGAIRVGFTGDQTGQLAALKQGITLMALSRVTSFGVAPQHSLTSLEALHGQVSALAGSSQPGLFIGSDVDMKSNQLVAHVSDVGQAENLLESNFGPTAPIITNYRPQPRPLKDSRERIAGPIRAGDVIRMNDRQDGPVKNPLTGPPCTAAYGAFEKGQIPATGQAVVRLFLLSAGHCMAPNHEVMRWSDPSQTEKQWIGFTRRDPYYHYGPGVDAVAIRLNSADLVPQKIFTAPNAARISVEALGVAPGVGTNICFSGKTSNRPRCGQIGGPPEVEYADGGYTVAVCFDEYIEGGDSGAPAWIQGTGKAVGIMVSGYGENENGPKEACFAPLKPYPGWHPNTAVFTSEWAAPLHLVTAP